MQLWQEHQHAQIQESASTYCVKELGEMAYVIKDKHRFYPPEVVLLAQILSKKKIIHLALRSQLTLED